MFNSISVSFDQLFTNFLLSLFIVFMGMILFYFLWLRPHGFTFEQGNNYSFEAPGHRNGGETVHTISGYVRKMRLIISDMNHEYWVQNAGLDGYAYLCFLQKMMVSLSIYFVVSVILYVIQYALIGVIEGNVGSVSRIMMTSKYQGLQEFYSTSLVILLSFLILRDLLDLRQHLQEVFFSKHNDIISLLKLRTIQIKDGREVRSTFNEFLKYSDSEGQLFRTLVIPTMNNLIDLESQRMTARKSFELIQASPPNCLVSTFLLPSYLKKEEDLKVYMTQLDLKMDSYLKDCKVGSNMAFVSVSSLSTVNECVKFFNSYDIVGRIEKGISQGNEYLGDKLGDGNWEYGDEDEEESYRVLNQSTLLQIKKNQENASELSKLRSINFSLTPFPHPVDINWRNVGQFSQVKTLKIVFLNMVMIFILLFLSTPTALLETLKKSQTVGKVIKGGFASDWPSYLKFLVLNLMPPLLTIIISNILLVLIFQLCYYKQHSRFSNHQISVLRYSFVYLIFNMLILPGLAAPAGTSLFGIIKQGVNSYDSFLKNFFSVTSGDFFLTLVIQSGATGFFAQVNMLSDLFMNYVSPYMTINYRRILSESEPWRKVEGEVLPYGYYYALTLSILAIAFVFGPKMPIIAPAAVFYLVLRFMGDAHLILLIHKYQIESSGILFTEVSRMVLIILMLSQFSAFLAMIFKGYYMGSFLVALLLIFTCLIYFFFWRPIINPQVFPDDSKDRPSEETIHKWWRFYAHPLTVSLSKAPNSQNLPSFVGTSMFNSEVQNNSARMFSNNNSFGNEKYYQSHPKNFNAHQQSQQQSQYINTKDQNKNNNKNNPNSSRNIGDSREMEVLGKL